MPIYEYYCPENNTLYSFLSKSIIPHTAQIRCPDNQHFTMQRLISNFSVTAKAKENTDIDETLEASLLSNIENIAKKIDPNNPDPKHMGQAIEKIAHATGECLDPVTNELVQRLKEGADLESLEAEMSPLMDLSDDTLETPQKAYKNKQKTRTKDPTLYELEDFIL